MLIVSAIRGAGNIFTCSSALFTLFYNLRQELIVEPCRSYMEGGGRAPGYNGAKGASYCLVVLGYANRDNTLPTERGC